MPLTVGPGSIATAISIVAGSKSDEKLHFIDQLPSIVGGLMGLIALSITIYFIYRESSSIQRIFGANGTIVLMRLFAFILLAIGVQIFLGGLEGFAGGLFKTLSKH